MALKDYSAAQLEKLGPKADPTPTDVACTETKCDGEMMWDEPRKKHPELKELARARCGECGWRGWV